MLCHWKLRTKLLSIYHQLVQLAKYHVLNVHVNENERKYICIKCWDIHLILTQNMVIPLIHLQVCFFSFWCFVEMKERGKVHWFLAAGGQNRPVQTRNYSVSLPRRHNIHIQQLSNSKGWWKKCFWIYQLTNIFM